jgi:hypothetical protein
MLDILCAAVCGPDAEKLHAANASLGIAEPALIRNLLVQSVPSGVVAWVLMIPIIGPQVWLQQVKLWSGTADVLLNRLVPKAARPGVRRLSADG